MLENELSNMTHAAVMQQITLQGEWSDFNKLTNNRKFKNNDVDTYKDVVLSGYNKIINFVNKQENV